LPPGLVQRFVSLLFQGFFDENGDRNEMGTAPTKCERSMQSRRTIQVLCLLVSACTSEGPGMAREPFGLPLEIHSVYSPAALVLGGRTFLLIGVAVFCTTNRVNDPRFVYRDSIALYERLDGSDAGPGWRFVKYVLEPDDAACSTIDPLPVSDAGLGVVFQVNDPTALVDAVNGREYVRIAYTAAEWNRSRWPHNASNDGGNQYGCGHLGMTVLDDTLTTVFTNHRFLSGAANCDANDAGWRGFGYSRPDFRQTNSLAELWFDARGYFFSTPFSALDVLANTVITDRMYNLGPGMGALDVHVLPFDREQTLLTFDLPTGLGLLALGDAGWSPPLVLVPSPQGQPWANAGLGAASTLLDRNRCTFELFLTARRQDGAAVYGTIAVAQPIDETGQPLRFAFPECSRR
jgi:hypothetical protein